jgi:hypothetical protein
VVLQAGGDEAHELPDSPGGRACAGSPRRRRGLSPLNYNSPSPEFESSDGYGSDDVGSDLPYGLLKELTYRHHYGPGYVSSDEEWRRGQRRQPAAAGRKRKAAGEADGDAKKKGKKKKATKVRPLVKPSLQLTESLFRDAPALSTAAQSSATACPPARARLRMRSKPPNPGKGLKQAASRASAQRPRVLALRSPRAASAPRPPARWA